MSYVYRKESATVWCVGYWHGEAFKVESRHDSGIKARRRVNYLNGGTVPQNSTAENNCCAAD
jgi:hypothetical protein